MNIFKKAICLTLLSVPLSASATSMTGIYNNHFYEVFLGSFTWDEANTAASSSMRNGVQGHLATVTDAGENSFIVSNLEHEGTFIGGTDKDVEGTWTWVTGEDFVYSDWNAGEPNVWNSLNEDYLMYWWQNDDTTTRWNDTVNNPYDAVGFDMGYIVEYDALAASAPVPVPAAVWLFATGLLGLTSVKRKVA